MKDFIKLKRPVLLLVVYYALAIRRNVYVHSLKNVIYVCNTFSNVSSMIFLEAKDCVGLVRTTTLICVSVSVVDIVIN